MLRYRPRSRGAVLGGAHYHVDPRRAYPGHNLRLAAGDGDHRALLGGGGSGLPVFPSASEKGIGIGYILSGNRGYLIGYVLAAVHGALTMFVANVFIYVPGLL